MLLAAFARGCRFLSSLHPPSSDRQTSQYIKPAAGLRKYLGSKLLRLYGSYDAALRRFPALYRVYRVFADGLSPSFAVLPSPVFSAQARASCTKTSRN